MKSYKSHLLSVKSYGENPIPRKPVYRGSAIFPVFNSKNNSTRILFMGYWIVKNGIENLALLITLRDEYGKLLIRENQKINDTSPREIHISDLLKDQYQSFTGSIELEIFSTVDLVFPFPAFVVNYFNDESSTSVHTTGRIYNDYEDMTSNNVSKVKECGFDILASRDIETFFLFVNGHIKNDNCEFDFEIINSNNESIKKSISIGPVVPLQTVIVKINDFVELEHFLKGEPGTIKINHTLIGFFPRFIAGNIVKANNSMSVTHTYYDNSEDTRESAYWVNELPEELIDSSVFVPILLEDNYYTQLKLYPIYSPSTHYMDIVFVDIDGNTLGSKENFIKIENDFSHYLTIDFHHLIKELQISPSIVKGAILNKHFSDKNKIPTRLKYGLNVGKYNEKYDIPTNICFASSVSNKNILSKPGTFKWMPILNHNKSTMIIQNSSFIKNYSRSAKIEIHIYSCNNDETIIKEFNIPANGQVRINNDEEIKNHLKNKSGWITVKSDNPFVQAWYLEDCCNGIIGGDHSF